MSSLCIRIVRQKPAPQPIETPPLLDISPFRRCLRKYCHYLRQFCYTQDVDTTV